MQTKEELIEAHWEEALVIDAKMREAAKACVKNFFGEEQEIPSLLTKQQWVDCGQAYGYLHELAWYYGMSAVGQRVLVQRPLIEFLFYVFTVNCTFGRDAALLLISSEPSASKLRYSFFAPNKVGQQRDLLGLQALIFYFHSFGQLPRTYKKLEGARWRVALKAFKRMFQKQVGPKIIQADFDTLSSEWGVELLPRHDPYGWLYEVMD